MLNKALLRKNGYHFAFTIAVLLSIAVQTTFGFSAKTTSTAATIKEQQETMDKIISSRRTVNNFETELPKNWGSAIARAINLAVQAPNHKRTEPWRFHLLGPDSIRGVCELNAELVTAKKGEEAGKKKLDRWLAMPGWLVVTCKKNDADADAINAFNDPAGLAREDYAACCCAVQNLCLSLHSENIGTKWTTGPVNFDERFNEAAGGIPSDEYVVGTIWFGTAAKEPPSPVKKLSFDDVYTLHT